VEGAQRATIGAMIMTRRPTEVELAAMLRAVRGVTRADSRPPFAPSARAKAILLLCLFSVVLAIFPHADAGRPFLLRHGETVSPSMKTEEEMAMSRMRIVQSLVAGSLAVGSSMMLAPEALAQQAVQWRVEDGGNGHWYLGVSVGKDLSWFVAKHDAELTGGHLATVTSAAEDDFVWSIASSHALWTEVQGSGWTGAKGPWLGLFQSPGNSPSEGWSWVTGEEFVFDAWTDGEPNDGCASLGDENALNYLGAVPGVRRWNDFPGDIPCGAWGFPQSYILEWSADCNNDGIVDYGQILAGELEDANNNGVPDCCDAGVNCDPCPGDVTRNGSIDGIDLAAVLAAWGGGKSQYDCDIDDDGIVGGSDLAAVLAGWGACP
jgi:hypothetical protein